MGFSARQPGPESGVLTNAPPWRAYCGVVEDGTSFHASSRGRLCPGADFWESFLNLAVAKAALLRFPVRHYCGAQRAFCEYFPLTRRQNLIQFFREVFLPIRNLVPTSKLGHLRKAEEGQALVLAA